MTSEIDNKSTNIEDVENEIVATAVDTLGDAITGIPAPIRKNAFKAFAQLCTATIDIPVAYLEGIASEKRAETQARVRIINTGAEQIAEQMEVEPEYARAAVKKFGQKIVREQVNLDVIAENAALELRQDPPEVKNEESAPPDEKEISEDWLNTFEKEACNKSSEEMQQLFGKILAGEIRKPSSYSIKSIKLISQLDNKAAKVFQVCCSMCVSLQKGNHIVDSRVVSLDGSAASNSLQKYGLSFDSLNILQEYGLIISDYNSYMNYDMCIANSANQVAAVFKYQGKMYGLVPQEGRSGSNNLRFDGVALTDSGKELLGIIPLLPSGQYTIDFKEYLQNKKLQTIEIG